MYIKNEHPDFVLKDKYRKKFCIQLKILTKYLLKPVYYPIVLITSITLSIPPLIEYFYNGIFITIFWNICFIITMASFFGIALTAFQAFYFSLFYLKYKFQQINDQIEDCLKNRNTFLLLKTVVKHNSISDMTKKLNLKTKYRIILFILYFMVRPAVNVLIYLTQLSETHLMAKIAATSVAVFGVCILFTLNYFCASLIRFAHQSYNILYAFLIKNRVTIKQQLKILSLIEKLSGRDIGFYCYDLFPLNNYEFYEFVSGWAKNYFLILDLI